MWLYLALCAPCFHHRLKALVQVARLPEEDKVQDGLAVMGKYPCLVNPLSTLNLLNVVWFLFRPATYIWASQTSRRITARAQSTNQHQQRAKYPHSINGQSTHTANLCGLLALLLPRCCPPNTQMCAVQTKCSCYLQSPFF